MSRVVRVAFFLLFVVSMVSGFVYADSGKTQANVLESPVCAAQQPAELSNANILAAINSLCPFCNAQGCCLRCRYDIASGRCICGNVYICE